MVVLVIALIITVVNLRNRPVETAGGPGAVARPAARLRSRRRRPPPASRVRHRQPVPSGFTDCSSAAGCGDVLRRHARMLGRGHLGLRRPRRWRPPRRCRSDTSIRPSPPATGLRRPAAVQAGGRSARSAGSARSDVVNSMLRKQDRRSDWEVYGDRPPVDRTTTSTAASSAAATRSKAYLLEPALTGSALGQPLDPVQQPGEQRSKSQPAGSSKPPASCTAAIAGKRAGSK